MTREDLERTQKERDDGMGRITFLEEKLREALLALRAVKQEKEIVADIKESLSEEV